MLKTATPVLKVATQYCYGGRLKIDAQSFSARKLVQLPIGSIVSDARTVALYPISLPITVGRASNHR